MANETSSSFSQIEHIAKYPTTTLTRLLRDQKPCSNQGGFAAATKFMFMAYISRRLLSWNAASA
jgi:hypothetical protein